MTQLKAAAAVLQCAFLLLSISFLPLLLLNSSPDSFSFHIALKAVAAVQPPHAQTATQAHHRRCRLTNGSWCDPYHDQVPIPAKLAPAYGKTCPGACSGVGVCNAMSGLVSLPTPLHTSQGTCSVLSNSCFDTPASDADTA